MNRIHAIYFLAQRNIEIHKDWTFYSYQCKMVSWLSLRIARVTRSITTLNKTECWIGKTTKIIFASDRTIFFSNTFVNNLVKHKKRYHVSISCSQISSL